MTNNLIIDDKYRKWMKEQVSRGFHRRYKKLSDEEKKAVLWVLIAGKEPIPNYFPYSPTVEEMNRNSYRNWMRDTVGKGFLKRCKGMGVKQKQNMIWELIN